MVIFHALEFIFGLQLGLRNGAMVACGSQGAEDISGLKDSLAQGPVAGGDGAFQGQFHALQEQSALNQKPVIISVRDAFDPGATGDFFGALRRDARRVLCLIAACACVRRIQEQTLDANPISVRGCVRVNGRGVFSLCSWRGSIFWLFAEVHQV